MMNYQKPLMILLDLTASFFETGAMATPTKSQNSTILDQGFSSSFTNVLNELSIFFFLIYY